MVKKKRIPEEILLLVAELEDYPGGEIFIEFFEDGLRWPWKNCEEEFRVAVKILEDEGEVEKAREMAKLLDERKYLDALKIYFKWYPAHGEYAGLFAGCLVKAELYNAAKELLEFIAETTDRFDT